MTQATLAASGRTPPTVRRCVLCQSGGALLLASTTLLTLASLLIAYLLFLSHQRYLANAAQTSQNLALSLQTYLHAHFRTADLALQSAADRLVQQQRQGRFSEADFSASLASLRQQVPDAEAMRGSDHFGQIIYGESLQLATRFSLEEREFFLRVRNGETLVFGRPVQSRVSGQPVLPLARPLYDLHGAFAGAVYVTTRLSSLTGLFRSLDLGPHGAITLIDAQQQVLARYPAPPQPNGRALHAKAPQLLAALAAGSPGATRDLISQIDQRRRIVSTYRVGNYPLFIAVGLDREAVLQPWRHELQIGLSFLLLLAGAVALMHVGMRHFWRARMQLQHLDHTRMANDHLVALLKAIPDLLFEMDSDGRYLDFRAMNDELLAAPYPHLLGRTVHDVLPPEAATEVMRALDEATRDGVSYGRQLYLQVPAGPRWFELSVARKDELHQGRPCFIVLSRDISERREAEQQIEQLAFSDTLTGLPNRRVFLDRLQQSLAASERNRQFGALLFLDLDKFKTLNDTRGHRYGDQLLIQVAERLRGVVREGDTVARLGGDEFVVILEQIGEQMNDASAHAMAIAEKISLRLREDYPLDGLSHRCSASIGIALFCGHQVSRDELIKRADLAMYQAKGDGRSMIRFFDPQTQARIETRVALEQDLQLAIARDEFLVYYQPQIDLTGRCIGAEALVRWQSGTRGLVSPAEFIPLAEESGLILPIGHRVMMHACELLQRWQHHPATAMLTLAVNVSARQFALPTFFDEVRHLLSHYGINPARLKLELTESMLIDGVEHTIATMRRLRSLGVHFSLDDFGTGYSCLNYLKRLPFSQVKIDQSFTRDVLSDANDAAICRAIIALGNSLGLNVIAEGVETDAQWVLLKHQGCHYAQGYLIGRPMPQAAFETWLAERQQ